MSNSGLQQVFSDQLTDSDGTKRAELGVERWSDGNKYRYVYNNSASNIVKNQAVAWEGYGFSVTPTTVAEKCIAGIAPIAIATKNYGWLTQEGFLDATTTGTITANDVLQVNSTAGVLGDGTNNIIAHAVADATSNVAKVYINC